MTISDDDRAEFAKYQTGGTALAQSLVKSCRDNDSGTAAEIAQKLMDNGDVLLLMMVLGQLTVRTVRAERRANQAHGPLIEGDDLDGAEVPVWQVGVADQLNAAANDNDHRAFAKTLVDAQIKALKSDAAENDLDFNDEETYEAVLRGLMMLNHSTLLICAAEMTTRLMGAV